MATAAALNGGVSNEKVEDDKGSEANENEEKTENESHNDPFEADEENLSRA